MVGTAGGNDPDTGDIYRGFDRFGRVKDNYWYDYGSSAPTSTASSTATTATATASVARTRWRRRYGKDFDELYGYDLIDRLKDDGSRRL